jgi:hypothetical protein
MPVSVTDDEAPERRLVVRSLLVAMLDRRAVLIGHDVRLDITLDVPCPTPGPTSPPSPPWPVSPWPVSVAELAERLGADDAGPLALALERAGLLSSCTPGVTRPTGDGEASPSTAGVVTLAAAMQSLSDEDLTRQVIVTATEALWTGTDPRLARLALTLFVARLAPGPRAQIYRAIQPGAAADHRPAEHCPAVEGDLPAAESLSWLAGRVGVQAAPESFDLIGRRRTGALASPQDALGSRADRLAVAGSLHETRIPLAEGALHLITGIAGEANRPGHMFADGPARPTIVMGADVEPAGARTRCYGEAAEYFLSTGGLPPQAVCAPADALPGRWLPPDAVISYQASHRERLGVRPFDPTEPEWWGPGRRNGRPVWIPAALTATDLPEDPGWWHPSAVSSNGVASHPCARQAAARAWLELVERDALQRARALAGADPPPRIDPTHLPPHVGQLHAALATVAIVTMLALTSPTGVPVALVRADGHEGELSLGAAADADPAVALRRALIEAIAQVGHQPSPVTDPVSVRTPGDHLSLYAQPAWRARLDWMLRGPVIDLDRIRAAQLRVPPRAVVHHYPRQGLSVHAVRVLDPLLIPLTFGYDSDPDGRADLAALWARSGRPLLPPWDPHPLG